MYSTAFLLSLSAFLISTIGGLVFVLWWFTNPARPKFLLLWAYGMFALLLFKIPNILLNAGMSVVQKELYLFFFVTMIAYFLSYFAFIKGLLLITGLSHKRSTLLWFRMWLLCAAAYFGLAFFAPGFDVSYTPVWASHLLFYIPVQVLLLFVLFRVLRDSAVSFHPSGAGIICTVLGTVTLLFSSVFYVLLQITAVSRSYWYYTIVSSPVISGLQIASAALLFAGFLLMARSYFRRG